MWVPLLGRDRVLGGFCLASATPARQYGPDDLRLAEELARRASLSLDNARLYRAAERAIAARDEVLAVVAHDLRNPLGTIMMQASVLQRRVGDPESSRPEGVRTHRARHRADEATHPGSARRHARRSRSARARTRAASNARCRGGGRRRAEDARGVVLDRAPARPGRASAGRSSPIATGCCRCSRTSSGTPSSSRRPEGASRWASFRRPIRAVLRPGHRSRHSRGGATSPVRPILAGASEPGGEAKRRRPGPPDRQGHRRGPRRPHLGRERAGRGEHVLLHDPNERAQGDRATPRLRTSARSSSPGPRGG